MTGGPVRVYLTGSIEGLAPLRDGIAAHPGVQVVGLAADPTTAGRALAESGAHVIVHSSPTADRFPAGDVEAIRALTAAPVVLLVPALNDDLLGDAVAAGILDVAVLSQPIDATVFAIKKAYSMATIRPAAAPAARGGGAGRVVTLFSPRGGAGKSSLALNLAALVAADGRRVLLLDLDLQFGDLALMAGLEPDKSIFDLVMAHRELDPDALAGYVSVHDCGLHVLPAPLRPEDAELITEERLASVFAVAKEAYDVVVVDTPAVFHGPVLATLDRTDALLLVATPDVPSAKNVKLALQTLDLLHFPAERRNVVINRSGSKESLRVSELERALDFKVRFEVPADREVTQSVNRGIPLAVSTPRSPVVKALAEIAEQLLPASPAAPARRRRLSRR
jgi:pilus assembly protein CpaE